MVCLQLFETFPNIFSLKIEVFGKQHFDHLSLCGGATKLQLQVTGSEILGRKMRNFKAQKEEMS